MYSQLDTDINKLLDEADISVGNEHKTYTTLERVQYLINVNASLWRMIDRLRGRESSQDIQIK